MPSPFPHRSGLPRVYDRSPDFPSWARVLFAEDAFLQGAELNEAQAIAERRGQRVGDLVAADGNRVRGAEIVVDVEGETVTLTAGAVYLRGDVRPVAAATLTDVPMTGSVRIGVRLVRAAITAEDNPDLLGLEPGTEAEGEPGAAREAETVAWGFDGDGGEGDLFTVYLLRDGVAIDQTPPPSLSGVNAAIANYDRDANGNYVVSGCRVTALGKVADKQVFSIEAGVANIYGFKRTRFSALRHEEVETFDVGTIAAEPHTFADGGGGTVTIGLNNTPISTIASVIVTKEVTEAVTRGGTTNGVDALAHSGVTEIVAVTQSATTFTPTTDYVLSGDQVSWAPGGDEPATGSSYNVTYRYLDAIAPDSFDDTSITISGGVTDTQVLVGYTWKLPRVDLLCLDQDGAPVYLKGLSARSRPAAPIPPANLLRLATVTNNWTGAPSIRNTDVRSIPYVEMWRYFYRLFDALDLIAIERLRRDIDGREPVAKRGVFVDPLVSDRYRDAGEAQTAAVFGGSMQLAIDPFFHPTALDTPVLLDYDEEIVIQQALVTGCALINPYQNFTPLPAAMQLTPPVDFWIEYRTEWLSDQTAVFGAGNQVRTTADERLVDEREELIEFLREIEVDFLISGFGDGEDLDSLTFDGVDVTPPDLTADEDGEIAGSFTIPAGITAGTKSVVATGAGGSTAAASFVGQGVVEIEVMQRVIAETRSGEWQGGGVGGTSEVRDPIAQTFWLPEPRYIAGVDLRFCAKGDEDNDVVVEIVTVENGIPTREVLTQATVDMATVALNVWTPIRWPMPIFLPADREFAFVVKTDDAEHSIAFAGLGDFDADAQVYVTAQPYAIGVMLTSSNALTWTPHQDRDVSFRLIGCLFDPTTKTVALGSHALVDASDIVVRAAVDLPTADAGFYFEIERADTSVVRLQPGQVWELAEYITETVALRAVLTGSPTISPVLFPFPLLIAGKIRTTGTYVTRAFAVGTGVRLTAYMKALLPAGSSIAVDYDGGDDDWSALDLEATDVLNDGWVERKYEADPVTEDVGRLRVTLTGGPAARLSIADPRVITV